jgi:preprotein translocase subunit SecG
MVTAVVILQVLISVLLVLVVLIQGGENVDMAAAFGGASQAAFGPRGAVTTIQKMTWVLAALFVITSMTLAIWSGGANSSSVLSKAPPRQATPAASPKK